MATSLNLRLQSKQQRNRSFRGTELCNSLREEIHACLVFYLFSPVLALLYRCNHLTKAQYSRGSRCVGIYKLYFTLFCRKTVLLNSLCRLNGDFQLETIKALFLNETRYSLVRPFTRARFMKWNRMPKLELLKEEWSKLNDEFAQLDDLHKQYKIKVCFVWCHLQRCRLTVMISVWYTELKLAEFLITLQVDEIEALQSKCKLGVKNHSNRLKEISSKLKAAIAEESSATRQVIGIGTNVKWRMTPNTRDLNVWT